MKYASDFKRNARHALEGNWTTAIWTGFVASLLGAGIATEVGGSSGGDSSDSTLKELLPAETVEKLLPFLLAVIAVLVVWSIVTAIIGGAAKLGYATFNLNLIDGKPAAFSDLFSQLNRFGAGFCMNFLVRLYVFLWSLLFVIPGIIKSYSYAMTPYILTEHPEWSASDAITESKKRMEGNKWRLFCLDFSFVGWQFLRMAPVLVFAPFLSMGAEALILFGTVMVVFSVLLDLYLRPYQEAAYAAFYRAISNNEV